MEMKVGQRYNTPRFCTVRICAMFNSRKEAEDAGFKEPTYWDNDVYGILGRSIDMYHMEFAGYRKGNGEGWMGV